MADRADATDEGLAAVASGASLVMAGRLLKLLLLFATQVLMARILGSTAYGGVILTTMLVALSTTVATVGMEKGLLREVAFHEDDVRRGRGAVRAGLGIAALTGTAAGAVTFLLAPLLATELFGDPAVQPLLRLGAVAIPFGTVGPVAIAVARGVRDTKPHVVVNQLLDPVLTVVLVGTLVTLGYGALGAVAGLVVTMAATTAVALWLMLRGLPFSLLGPHETMYAAVLSFSVPLLFAASMEFVVHHTDTFLIGVYLASSDVGVYNVAYQLREVGHFFFYPATFLLPPVLTRLSKDGERAAGRRIYQVTTKWIVLLTAPVFLFVLLFPDVVIERVFGPAYLPGVTALRLLLSAIMITVLFGANGLALVALGHNRVNLYVDASAAATNVVLNVLLIPQYGIEGAAVASLLAYNGRDVAYSVVLYRREGIHPFSAAMLRPFSGTLVVTAVGYAAFVTFLEPTVPAIAVASAAFALGYPLLLVALGALEPEDERLLDELEGRLGVRLGRTRAAVTRLR